MILRDNFTKSKFQKLQHPLKHKKCADLLRHIYESLLENRDISEALEKYGLYLSWMQQEPFTSTHLKTIADRYHWHLGEANILLKEHSLLPAIRRGDRAPKEEFPSCAIYLDNLRSAYNVGSILRTIEALRIGSLHFGGKTPFIDNSKVHRTSMGADGFVSCHPKANIDHLPRPFIALETAENATSVSSFLFPETFTIILGNEEYGISDEILKKVDYFVDIPLFGAKNSINVACAFGICAQEIRRQKSLKRASHEA